jgi:hypothetical protein
MMAYVGETVRLHATFTNFARSNADPTTITVIYRTPSGTPGSSTYASSGVGGWTRTAPGVYAYDLPVTESGTWVYAFEGTGTVDTYRPSTFDILPRPVG